MLQESRAMFQRVRDSGTVSPFSRCPPARGGGTPPPAVAPCGPDRTVCIRKAVVQLCCTVKDVPWVKKFFQKKRRKRLTEGGHFDRPLFAPTSASFPGGSIGRAGDCQSLGWRFKSVPGSQKVQGLTVKAVGPFLVMGNTGVTRETQSKAILCNCSALGRSLCQAFSSSLLPLFSFPPVYI